MGMRTRSGPFLCLPQAQKLLHLAGMVLLGACAMRSVAASAMMATSALALLLVYMSCCWPMRLTVIALALQAETVGRSGQQAQHAGGRRHASSEGVLLPTGNTPVLDIVHACSGLQLTAHALAPCTGHACHWPACMPASCRGVIAL